MADKIGVRRPTKETLFPAINPHETGRLQVSKVHSMYYELSGNPSGYPVVFIHGGPGYHTEPDNRRFFDPEFYKIILFDQRGCGKSTPFAETQENTTPDLVSDMEKLRNHLGIDKWLLFGGSWGSTLAIAYSIKHPKQTKGRIIRGIFLARESEIDWLYEEGGAANIFPEAWEKFTDPIPRRERKNIVSAYHKQLTSKNLETRMNAAQAWGAWEGSISKLIPSREFVEEFSDPHESLAIARIENHYFVNRSFFPNEKYLLNGLRNTRNIPTRIIQGRYDICCPIRTAWDAKKALDLPDKEFRAVPDAGHSGSEPGIQRELVQATQDFKIYCRNEK